MPFHRLAGILAFLLACACPCRSQPDLRYVSHQTWSTEEGLPQNSVHAIAQTPDGYLWIATESGLARFDGIQFRIFNRASEPAFPSNDLCCLAVQASGDLLIGTADGTVRESHGFFSRDVAPIETEPAHLTDRKGLTWTGSRTGLTVSAPGERMPVEVLSLRGNSILSLLEDTEGDLWIGTETTGLHVLRRAKFRADAAAASLAVTSVVQANGGAMWIGTRDDGLRRLVSGRLDEPAPGPALTSAVILALAPAASGAVWAGTPDGLNLVSASGKVQQITSVAGLPDDYIRALAPAPDGSVWIGTEHGLAHWSGGRTEIFTTADGLASDLVGSLLLDSASGRLWIGTANGVSTLTRGSQKIATSLVGRVISAIAPAPGDGAWAATQSGALFLLRPGSDPAPVSGLLSSAPVASLTADRQGQLWFRTDRGISRISQAALIACTRKACTAVDLPVAHYSLSDGLPSEEIVARSPSPGWLADDGEIWFPTRRGLAIADTSHLPVDILPPAVVIEGFSADGRAQASGTSIPYGGQRFTFDYAGLSFTAPAEVRYRVRLEGFDRDWIDAGAKRTATYTNLPPGPYRFSVQAVNGDGVWNRNGTTLNFRILAPFYRRWWFLALMLFALGIILAALYLMRLRGLQRGFNAVLAERSRMAREIHDTLTQDFVGTSLQLDIVAGMLRKGRIEQALEQVARTRRLVTEGLDEARQSIWELRANNAEDTLPIRLTRLVHREAYAAVAARLRVTGAYRALQPHVEREVLRIAQEALSNVLRHAQATETSVDLHYSDEALLLTIEDNGAGFDLDRSRREGHYGLTGMNERAANIGGDLSVTSQHGLGSKVVLRLKVM